MMRFWKLMGLMGGVVGVAAGGAAYGKPVSLFKATAEELVEVVRDEATGEIRTRQVQVDYHPLNLSTPPYRELLARETVSRVVVENTEGESAQARVDLYFRKEDKSYPVAADHTTTVPEASRVEFKGDHWSATIFGCCDAEPISQLFAYGEGKPFLYGNGKYAMFSLPNAGFNRYAGVVLRAQVGTEALETAVFGKDKEAVAAVLFGGPGMKMEKLLLGKKEGVKEEEVPYHTLDVDVRSSSKKDEVGYDEDREISKVLILWSQDTLPGQTKPASVGGASVVASFSGSDGTTETVTVPVEGDKFVAGKARLSGQTLRVVGGAK